MTTDASDTSPASPTAQHVFAEALRGFVAARVEPSDVEDVLQQAHLKLLERPVEAQHLSGYVYQVVRSVIADHHRRRGARDRRRDDATLGADAPGDHAGLEPHQNVEPVVASWLPLFLAGLPTPYRETLELTELEGRTHADAARALGVARTTVTSRVDKGRAMVRDRLERCCRIELDARRRVVGYERRDRCDCRDRSRG